MIISEKKTKTMLPDRICREIRDIARKNNIDKVFLFGSRARGMHTERSDIDIAVYGENFQDFYWDIKENAHTLLMFDIVDMKSGISDVLMEEIERDGVLLYEKD